MFYVMKKKDMNRVRRMINADKAYKYGIYGKGIGVAVLDTGIYPHEDFRDRITCFHDFVNGKSNCYDDCSHGTHVAGILAGNGQNSYGKYRGIAPESNIISLKVLDRQGNGIKEDILKAIDWVIQCKEEYNIKIVNISVGTTKEGEKAESILTKGVDAAWDAGLVVVVAAGNMGPEPHSITIPGTSRKVITVGSSDDCTYFARGRKSCYSGRGPTDDCICKPDISAPGSSIISCNAPVGESKRLYGVKSGTSMSTPIVSGAIALLLSKEPHLSNLEVKMRLHDTALDIGLPKAQQGWGQLDIARLLHIT